MTRLVGVSTLRVDADRRPTSVFVGLTPGSYTLQISLDKPAGLGDFLASALKVDEPRQIYFAVGDEHGVSNEISKTLTLRATATEIPVPPIVLSDIEIELDITSDDDDGFDYHIEVTS